MKNKTLALITAVIITAAALTLTAGLSLLKSSAENTVESIAESTIENGISAESTDEVTENIEVTEETAEEPDVTEPSVPVSSDSRLPALDTLEAVKVVEEEHFILWEYVLWRDIVIDVFDNSTGELVGQVYLTDDEIYAEFCKIFEADFDYTAELFDPNDPEDVPVYLPEAKYRVEFFWIERLTANASGCAGSLAFSYGLENNEIYEFTQTGYPLANGETVIAFMESLIADEIAKIEAGNGNDFDASESMATVIGFEDCWNGTTLPNGEFLEGTERYTPRFPYINN